MSLKFMIALAAAVVPMIGASAQAGDEVVLSLDIDDDVMFRNREFIQIEGECVYGQPIEYSLPPELSQIENPFSTCQKSEKSGWFYLRMSATADGRYSIEVKQNDQVVKRTLVVRQLEEKYSPPIESKLNGMYLQRHRDKLVVQGFDQVSIFDIATTKIVKQLNLTPNFDAKGERALMVLANSNYAYIYRQIRKTEHAWLPSVAIDIYSLEGGGAARLIKRVPSKLDLSGRDDDLRFYGFNTPRFLPLLTHQRGKFLYVEATERDIFNWHYKYSLRFGLDLNDPEDPREIRYVLQENEGFSIRPGSQQIIGEHCLSIEKNEQGSLNLLVHEIRQGKLEWPIVAKHALFDKEISLGRNDNLSSIRQFPIFKNLENPEQKAFVLKDDGKLYEFDAEQPQNLSPVAGVPAIVDKEWKDIPIGIAIYRDMYFYQNSSYDAQWQYDLVGSGLNQGYKSYHQGHLDKQWHREPLVYKGCVFTLTDWGVSVHSGLPDTQCQWE